MPKTIEIRTTQNVVIDYELAILRDRIFAFFLDQVILGGFMVFAIYAMLMTVRTENAAITMWFVFIMPIFFFYTPFCDSMFHGRTIGKMALRLKVVRLDGRQLTLTDNVLRWAFRLIDIWFSVGILASILVSTTDRKQRLGDLISNAVLVKTSPSLRITLKQLDRIDTLKDYQPRYSGVVALRESDMLLAKQTLERLQRFQNAAHREAVKLMAERFATLLELPSLPEGKPEDFVRTVLRDYVVLTR
jgi:uncharacterized RDD family membrane protein YckC